MKETCKSIRSLLDTAFSNGFGGSRFSFVLVMDICGYPGERKMFYFHEAKATEWNMSIWKSNPFKDYPVKVVLESASGLQLVYHKEVGLSIVNTKRFKPSYRHGDVRRTHVRYEQSLRNREIIFYRVN